ncbi:hypothetical protein [Paraburkholderia bannensis]|uniref:hypothetical protein n=1 Tax=Paraburkholderia bannensis TaxID=765414 RepID=UPI002AB7C732|nr:hypothetical protein [Paraburkholderia bannensis]
MELVSIKRLGVSCIMLCGALFHGGAVAGGVNGGECFTRDDVKRVEQDVVNQFPNAAAMTRYAGAEDLRIATNVPEGISLKTQTGINPEKSAWIARFVDEHIELFRGFRFAPVAYMYIHGAISVDNLRESSRFPDHGCVQEIYYNNTPGSCVRGQKLQSLSVDFVKENGAIRLAGSELFVRECTIATK